MKHNRPYYGKKITIIIPEITKHFVMRSLPRWLEQTYENNQIILVGKKEDYTDVKKILQRHGLEIGYSEDFLTDHKCLLFYNQINDRDKTISQIMKEIDNDIICVGDNYSTPLPYFLELIMTALDDDTIVKCGDCFCRTTSNEPSKELIINQCVLQSKFSETLPEITVFIPVMNRKENIQDSLSAWLTQTYANYKIVVIDYSSKEPILPVVKQICDERKIDFSSDLNSKSTVQILRIENQKFFNISHAYNCAIRQIDTDIVSIACADSVPWDFYLEMCANLVNNKNILQIHWGLHTITKENWKKLNGHQEFIVGWGAEDDDFRIRANLMGLETIVLPSKFVFQIPTGATVKSLNREIPDLSESSLTNMVRFEQYRARYGYEANYGEEIGQFDQIVKYRYPDKQPINRQRLFIFDPIHTKKENLPSSAKHHKDFDLFYILTETDMDCQKYGPVHHYYIDSEVDIEKYLSLHRQI